MTPSADPPAGHRDIGGLSRRAADTQESRIAARTWWDAEADDYLTEHGDFLGDADFMWCPEGVTEAAARLLGDVRGRRVLEIGCGAAQCSRWLDGRGAQAVGLDLSAGMLRTARRLDVRTSTKTALVQADATVLPFADAAFDLACSAFGAVPFVDDSAAVMREVARVLRPGGRWVFAVPHPTRWSFADDPGDGGLVARESYFDRRAYVEEDESGQAIYVEHHRTIGDRVREIVSAGLQVSDIVEPEWPAGSTAVWGQWGPVRGAILPGTAIFVCNKPAGVPRRGPASG